MKIKDFELIQTDKDLNVFKFKSIKQKNRIILIEKKNNDWIVHSYFEKTEMNYLGYPVNTPCAITYDMLNEIVKIIERIKR